MNIFKVPNTYYRLFIQNNPKFKFFFFTPQFSITRVNANIFKIFVEIYQTNVNTNKTVLKKEIEIDQTITDPEQYFKNLQNSNFTDIFEKPALVLEKIVAAVQEIGNGEGNKNTTSVTVTSSNAPVFTITQNTPKAVTFTISPIWWIDSLGSISPSIYDQSISFTQNTITGTNLSTSVNQYSVSVNASTDSNYSGSGPFVLNFQFNSTSKIWVIQSVTY